MTQHIPTPYKDGNKVLKEYFVERMSESGVLQIYTLVDYKTKSGEVVEGYVMRVKNIYGELTRKNTSELNIMNSTKISELIEDYMYTYKDNFNSEYLVFLNQQLQRHLRAERNNKKYYEVLS